MDNEELTRHMTRLTNTVTELLLWVQEAESQKVLPPGTLLDAHRVAEEGRVMNRVTTLRETLDLLDRSDSIEDLRESLKDSLRQLENRVEAMRRAHGKT